MFFFTIQPNWLFQSLENTYEIASYFIISRFFYIGLVFVFVNAPHDYYKVIICLGLCFSINAILSLRKMIKLGYLPTWPSVLAVRSVIFESSGFFYARASSSIYGAGGTVFLGLVSTNAQVGYFSSAEQIFRGLQGLFTPVAQAIMTDGAGKQHQAGFQTPGFLGVDGDGNVFFLGQQQQVHQVRVQLIQVFALTQFETGVQGR